MPTRESRLVATSKEALTQPSTGGISVHKSVIASAAVSIAAIVLPSFASGAPKPHYTGACVLGGDTSINWQREKVAQVTIEWSAPAGSGVTFDPFVFSPPSQTPPRGIIVLPTPSSTGTEPISATASFQHSDGTTDELTVVCG